MLKKDQVWKKSLMNSNNQRKIGFEKICFLSKLTIEKKRNVKTFEPKTGIFLAQCEYSIIYELLF